jgi:hypothetical protein
MWNFRYQFRLRASKSNEDKYSPFNYSSTQLIMGFSCIFPCIVIKVAGLYFGFILQVVRDLWHVERIPV